MDYEILLFVEIIESVSGVTWLRDEEFNGIKAKCYQGPLGKLVIIDITEEYPTSDTCKGWLTQLGLSDLIPAMFPEPKVVEADSPE